VADLAPIAVAVPLLAAAGLVGAAVMLPRAAVDAVAVVAAIAVAVLCALVLSDVANGDIVFWFGGWTPRDGAALGVAFAIDQIGAGLALFIAVTFVGAFVFSWRYFVVVGPFFHALMLVFLAAMVGFSYTGDLFNLFVFFELLSVAAYALVAYDIEEEGPIQGALNFAVTNSVGAFFILSGIALLYGRTGALNMAQIGEALAGGNVDGLVVVSFTLITVGFLTKAAVVPFHLWLADAYSVAPTPVCMLLSAAMSELGLYALARVYWTVFSGVLGGSEQALQIVFIGAGVITALVGAILCFGSRHLKRMLAFATIAHVGLFLIGLGLLDSAALAGVALFVVADGFLKASLFVSVGVLQHLFHTVDELGLRGRARKLRITGPLVVVCGLCVASLPPFGPWLGKALIEEAAGDAGYAWLPVVFVIVSALTGGAVLRASGRVFAGLGPERDPITAGAVAAPHEVDPELRYRHDRVPRTMTIPALALAASGLALGLVPGLRDVVLEAGARFSDRSGYAASVLHGASGHQAEAESIHPTVVNVLTGVLTVALAAYFAGAALFRERMPVSLVWTETLGAGVVARLRSIHTSNAGDYVTWLTLGTATLAAIFALTLTT
jgi:formate hydrogenlyase subunit 3/multisubunit Na+/H+ antiporter MnhD subunit